MIETDGPYGGALCNSHNHTHHRGLLDSQYWQMRLQAEQYHKMRRLGVFVDAPDVRLDQCRTQQWPSVLLTTST